jgi:hypothetical protein
MPERASPELWIPLAIALIEKPPKGRGPFHVDAEELCSRLLFDFDIRWVKLKVIRRKTRFRSC